jgi:YD repeat-containing protein
MSADVTDPLGRVTVATYDPAGRQLSQTALTGN